MPAVREEPSADPSRIEDQIASVAWLRRLAVAIVHDTDVAEDIAQDALLAAHRGRANAVHREPGWFARVVRNLAFTRLRRDARRTDRERIAGRSEAGEEPAAALVRLEVQEELLRAVRNLSEPYRSTVLLRWFDGLDATEVARRMNVPLRTVHTRTTRALALLRDDLDRRSHGDRSRWMSACLPFVASSKTLPWIVLMKTNLKSAVVVVLVLLSFASLLILSRTSSKAAPTTDPRVTLSPASTASQSEATVASSEPRVERTALGSAPEAKDEAAEGVIARSVAGRVIDASGEPLALVHLKYVALDAHDSANGALATTDATGRFEIRAAAEGGSIVAADKNWITLFEPHTSVPDPADGYVLVLATHQRVRGVVMSAKHEPIAHASVWMRLGGATVGMENAGSKIDPRSEPNWLENGEWETPADSAEHASSRLERFGDFGSFDTLRSGLDLPLDRSVARIWKTRTDDRGRFEFVDAPRVASARLLVRAAGFVPRIFPLGADRDGVVVDLEATPAEPVTLDGRVVDSEGKPVGDATVIWGERMWRSDGEGRFACELRAEVKSRSMIVTKPGCKPCSTMARGEPGLRSAWPQPLVIRLEKEPLAAIRGVVVNASKQPLRGIILMVLDPITVAELRRSVGESPSEEVVSYGADFSSTARTDADGKFVLTCALPRAFRIRVLNSGTLECLTTDPIVPGGPEIVLQLGVTTRTGVVRGQIVDPRGVPIAGAKVHPQLLLPGSERGSRACVADTGTKTDDEGRFELQDVSLEVRELAIQVREDGPGVTRDIDRSSAANVRIVVGRLGHLCVRIESKELDADNVAVLDQDGRVLQLGVSRGDSAWYGDDSMPLLQRRSEPILVPEDGSTLVLRSGNREVARKSIHVLPDVVNTIEM